LHHAFQNGDFCSLQQTQYSRPEGIEVSSMPVEPYFLKVSGLGFAAGRWKTSLSRASYGETLAKFEFDWSARSTE
jgi:hypothetical protein